MRQGQLLGYFGIFLGAFAIISVLLVIPTIICAPLGAVCSVRAIRHKQRSLGIIGISLCALAILALLAILFFSLRP